MEGEGRKGKRIRSRGRKKERRQSVRHKGGLCKGQGEVKRNAVTVDRGPVLVQVLQSPTELTKRNNDENDEYPAAAPDPTVFRRSPPFNIRPACACLY